MTTTIQGNYPTANIAVGKSRVKSHAVNHQSTYFLQDDTEFQLELYNPTNEEVIARLYINGETEGGIILRPAERVWIERYLKNDKKLRFTTYFASGDKQTIERATKNNGLISVRFCKKAPTYTPPIKYIPDWYPSWPSNPNIFYYGTNSIPLNGTITTTNSSNFSSSLNVGQSSYSTSNNMEFTQVNKPLSRSKSIETGRVSEGAKSNQEFQTVSDDYYNFPFHTVDIKILPVSQKTLTVGEVNTKIKYCTTCGKKVKSEHSFCGYCGCAL